LTDARQVDALGVDVVVAARLLDGPEDVILDEGVRVVVGAPAEAGPAVGAVAQLLRAAQADADVVAAAQARGQPQDLLLVAAPAVEEHQQRVRITGLVAGRQEGPHRQPARGVHLGGVEAFRGAKRTPGEIDERHATTRYARGTDFADGRRRAPAHRPGSSLNYRRDSRLAKSTLDRRARQT